MAQGIIDDGEEYEDFDPRAQKLEHKEFLKKQLLEAAFPTIDDRTTKETIAEYEAEFLKVLDAYENFLAESWGTEGWDSSSVYC